MAKTIQLEELTYKINGSIYEVNKILGSGFLEKVYENALFVELNKRGINAACQVPITVEYKNATVGQYIADMIVEDSVLIEIKAIEALQKVHEAQILNYLKATGYKVGLLVNFTHPKAIIKRFVL